ncbi:MAG: serpin family protein [archaeon]
MIKISPTPFEVSEAAAATGIIMAGSSGIPEELKYFTSDHPFIFIIQQKDSGNILFIGRMSNPSKA